MVYKVSNNVFNGSTTYLFNQRKVIDNKQQSKLQLHFSSLVTKNRIFSKYCQASEVNDEDAFTM